MTRKIKYKMRGSMLLAGLLSSILFIMLAGAYFTTIGGSFGMIKNSHTALQAQQYAEIASNELSLIPYDELDRGGHARQPVANAFGWEDEITVSAEKVIDTDTEAKQRIAEVKIYKEGDVLSRYSLKVPLSSVGNNLIPKGSIFPYWGSLSDIPHGYAYCDGTNGTPDLRGVFLSGTSAGIPLGARTGDNNRVLSTGNLPGNALVALNGYFAIGGYTQFTDMGGENQSPSTTTTSWGTGANSNVTHITGSGGNDKAGIYFRSFNAAISSMGWYGAPFDNRPFNVAVHYIMKIK